MIRAGSTAATTLRHHGNAVLLKNPFCRIRDHSFRMNPRLVRRDSPLVTRNYDHKDCRILYPSLLSMGLIDPRNAVLPEQFGKYSLLGHLATGGMAEVWLARQVGLQGFE